MSGGKLTNNPSRENSKFGSQGSSRAMHRPHRLSPRTGDDSRPECQAIKDNGLICGETKTLSITDELKELYENRLRKLDEDIGKDAAGDSCQVQLKVNVLQSWVQDLLEQNAELVHTVEELEQEMGYRVKLLEEKLVESARACREYMTKLHDFDAEMHDSAANKEELARLQELIKRLQAELQESQESNERSNGGSTDKDDEIAKLKEHLGLKDDQIRSLIQRIQELRGDIRRKSVVVTKLWSKNTTDASTMTDERNSSMSIDTSAGSTSDNQYSNKEDSSWKENATDSREIVRIQYELQRAEVATIAKHNDNIILSKQLEEAELFLELALRDKEHLADKLVSLDMRLDDKAMEVVVLTKSLAELDKVARDMQSALTAEVAEKHDLIIMLRREVYQLEDQCRQFDKQTHFKDDIIKEMRKEIKQSRSRIIELEQQVSEKFNNTDKNRRFSSSPQLGHTYPTAIQSDQYLKNKPAESNIDLEPKSPDKTVTYMYQDKASTNNVYPKSTQCDLPARGTKPRSKVSKFHRHSIGDCTPSTGYHCGDVGGQQLLLSDGKAQSYHRSYSPPCKDVRGTGNSHLAQNSAFPMEEVRPAENDPPRPGKHHRALHSSAWQQRAAK